jgi:tRNA A-37 threonylcarbamoyl transferase component Bud32
LATFQGTACLICALHYDAESWQIGEWIADSISPYVKCYRSWDLGGGDVARNIAEYLPQVELTIIVGTFAYYLELQTPLIHPQIQAVADHYKGLQSPKPLYYIKVTTLGVFSDLSETTQEIDLRGLTGREPDPARKAKLLTGLGLTVPAPTPVTSPAAPNPYGYCSRCGAQLQQGRNFCGGCGAALASPSVAVPAPMATGRLPEDTTLNGRYRIQGLLGEGGMGAVYKAQDLQLGNRLVAIKEMSQQGLVGADLQQAIAAFQHEATLLAHLTHPNLPRIYGQFKDKDSARHYLVMDFIEGETLEETLETMQKRGQRFSIEQVISLAYWVAVVLEYLHAQQIIFRDLKPGNIMLSPNGQVYLIDFGIARLFKSGQAKDTVALGSPGYAAPEQYGKEQSTHKTDIYALGATLHRLLSGIDPSDNPFSFAPLTTIPPALAQLVAEMVDMKPQERPGSAAEVRVRLRQISEEMSNQPPPSPPAQGQKPQKRWRLF